MTTQNLTNKHSFMGAYFLMRLKDNTTAIIMNCIFALLSFPFLGGFFIYYANCYANEETMQEKMNTAQSLMEVSVIVCIIALIGIFVLGTFNAVIMFPYFTKRSKTDMFMVLPLTGRQRFFADFWAGLASSAVPYILSCVIGFILFQIGFGIVGDEAVSSYMGNIRIFELAVYLGGFIAILSGYALSSMITCCSGKTSSAAIATFITICAVPLTLFFVICTVFLRTFGIEVWNIGLNAFSYTPPIGFVCTLVNSLVANIPTVFTDSFNPLSITIFNPSVIIVNVFIIAAMTALAYFASKYRKAEKSGESFAYKWVYHVVLSLFVFLISILMMYYTLSNPWSDKTINMVILVVISFIVFVILEIICNKGFKKFWFVFIRYAATLGLSVGISLLLVNSCGFGASYYIPSEDDIKGVTLDFSIGNYIYLDGQNIVINSTQCDNIMITDKNTIKYCIDRQKQVIDLYSKTVARYGIDGFNATIGYFPNSDSFNVTYYMKNGSTVKRSYQDYYSGELKPFTAEQYSQAVKETLIALNNSIGSENFSATATSIDNVMASASLPENSISDIINAALEDMGNVAPEKQHIRGMFSINSNENDVSIYVTDGTENLNRVIEEYGITLPSCETEYDTIEIFDGVNGVYFENGEDRDFTELLNGLSLTDTGNGYSMKLNNQSYYLTDDGAKAATEILENSDETQLRSGEYPEEYYKFFDATMYSGSIFNNPDNTLHIYTKESNLPTVEENNSNIEQLAEKLSDNGLKCEVMKASGCIGAQAPEKVEDFEILRINENYFILGCNGISYASGKDDMGCSVVLVYSETGEIESIINNLNLYTQCIDVGYIEEYVNGNEYVSGNYNYSY